LIFDRTRGDKLERRLA